MLALVSRNLQFVQPSALAQAKPPPATGPMLELINSRAVHDDHAL
jgi:hypothetical protein